MAKAIIHKPAKSAMQSGKAKYDIWLLEFEPEDKKIVDNLMGWQGSDDMKQELRMKFESREAAIEYAQKNEINFEVSEPHPRKLKIQTYADNFVA